MYVSDFAGYVSVDVPVAEHSPSPIFWKISGNAVDAEYEHDVWTSTSLLTSVPILTIHFLCFNMQVGVHTLSCVSKRVVLTCMLLRHCMLSFSRVDVATCVEVTATLMVSSLHLTSCIQNVTFDFPMLQCDLSCGVSVDAGIYSHGARISAIWPRFSSLISLLQSMHSDF